jgi:hypothetical protein
MVRSAAVLIRSARHSEYLRADEHAAYVPAPLNGSRSGAPRATTPEQPSTTADRVWNIVTRPQICPRAAFTIVFLDGWPRVFLA